ncbi:MAG: hypothetical protein ACI9GW_000946 [Halieaceae bacterium]|jgi:hypothetical protein
MNQRFVVSNESGHYYSKSKAWTDGRDAGRVYCPQHRDEALNTLLEINSRDIDLRGMILEVETNHRGLPVLEISDIPLPEVGVEESVEAEEEEAEASNVTDSHQSTD